MNSRNGNFFKNSLDKTKSFYIQNKVLVDISMDYDNSFLRIEPFNKSNLSLTESLVFNSILPKDDEMYLNSTKQFNLNEISIKNLLNESTELNSSFKLYELEKYVQNQRNIIHDLLSSKTAFLNINELYFSVQMNMK